MRAWKDTCPLRPESELASVPERELCERLKENGLIVSRTTSISMTNEGSVKNRIKKEEEKNKRNLRWKPSSLSYAAKAI